MNATNLLSKQIVDSNFTYKRLADCLCLCVSAGEKTCTLNYIGMALPCQITIVTGKNSEIARFQWHYNSQILLQLRHNWHIQYLFVCVWFFFRFFLLCRCDWLWLSLQLALIHFHHCNWLKFLQSTWNWCVHPSTRNSIYNLQSMNNNKSV